MPRCPACPVAPDSPCVGESAAVFCTWAASGNPVKIQSVVLRSAVGVGVPGIQVQAPVATTQPDGPGLFRKAATLGKAIVDHVAAGMHATDNATVEARWATCRQCEMFDATNVVCRACGCFLNVKIRMAEQHCPIGKW